jgi:membrane associated rhomboid family serine protease
MTDLPPPRPDAAVAPSADMCHRHPGRPAGRRCTRCARLSCADCLTPGAVGSICHDCRRASRPAASVRARQWSARNSGALTRAIIAVNVAVFAVMTVADAATLNSSVTALHADLGLYGPFIDGPQDWYRFATSGFIHFGAIHLAFNMFLLYQLGRMLEGALGPVSFSIIYLTSIFGGSAGALALQPNGLHGGASGAVFGLMGFAAIGFWRRGVNPMNTGIGSLLLMNLLITFVVPGISIGGHLGGVVAGGACALVESDRRGHTRRPSTVALVTVLCAVAFICCVVIASR